jgi:hypothetical protein
MQLRPNAEHIEIYKNQRECQLALHTYATALALFFIECGNCILLAVEFMSGGESRAKENSTLADIVKRFSDSTEMAICTLVGSEPVSIHANMTV